MTILGMPPSMFAVFVATVAAGSAGAVHYLVVHVLLAKPFGDEKAAAGDRDTNGVGAEAEGVDGDAAGDGASGAAARGDASVSLEAERREGT